MADAAARREARRRKILENSESRLQVITGQSTSSGEKLSGDVGKCSLKSEISTSSKVNGSIPNESPVDSWNIPSEFQEDFPSDNLFESNPLITEANARRRNFGYTPNGEVQGHVHNEERFNGETSSGFSRYGETNSRSSISPQTLKSSAFVSFFASRWVYVILAAVINVIIVLRAEYLFGTSIIVPFLLLFISRMLLCNKHQESQSGSMVFAALILCNIRPEVIHRLKVSSALFSRIFNEFLLFLSSFVLIYYFFTSYWLDFDDLAPSKAKVIINGQTEL